MSNSKPATESSEPLETEQGSRTNESDSENNAGELTVDPTKEGEVLENGVIENDKKEAPTTAKPENKRKIPNKKGEEGEMEIKRGNLSSKVTADSMFYQPLSSIKITAFYTSVIM